MTTLARVHHSQSDEERSFQRYAEAVEFYKDFFASNKLHFYPRFYLIRTQMEFAIQLKYSERYDEAKQLYLDALENLPETRNSFLLAMQRGMYESLSDLYRRMGDSEAERDAWAKAEESGSSKRAWSEEFFLGRFPFGGGRGPRGGRSRPRPMPETVGDPPPKLQKPEKKPEKRPEEVR